MYIPDPFRESRLDALFVLMDRYPFATLITGSDDGPFASHIPFVLDRTRGPNGTLIGHLARANPQWGHFAEGRNVLVIFQGPHAYVSPSWYEPRPTNVPTWNYVVVHARGPALLLPEGEATVAVVRQLTDVHERRVGETQAIGAENDDVILKMSRGIVAFEIPIVELSGKSKLSQNRSEGDQQSVRAHLAASADPLDRETAEAMGQSGKGHDR